MDKYFFFVETANRERYLWFRRQALWHKIQARKTQKIWHWGQYEYYNSQKLRLVPFTGIVTVVFKKHLKQLTANITANNALFNRLTERRLIK